MLDFDRCAIAVDITAVVVAESRVADMDQAGKLSDDYA